MDVTEKICKAEEQKKAGNAVFTGGNLRQAIKKYHFALLYLKDIEKPSPLDKMAGQSGKKVGDEDLYKINNLRGVCYNNLSACLLQKENYDKVIEYTTKTLDIDPSNIKALFRRGQAYMTKDISKAEKDFLEIKKLDDKEMCVEKFFPLIAAKKKCQLKKEKVLCKKMMNLSDET